MSKLERLAVWVEAVRMVAPLGIAVNAPVLADLVREASIYVEEGVGPADAVDFASVHVLKRQGLPPPARLRRPRCLRRP